MDLEHRQSIKELMDCSLGQKEEGVICSIRVSITHLHHDRKPWYAACPSKGCNKKVEEIMGIFHCSKCSKDFQECAQRYILSCICSDFTGQLTLTLYNEQAEKLLGINANQLSNLLEDNNILEYEKRFTQVLFKSYVMVVKIKNKVVKNDVVLESTVLHLEDVCWGVEGAQLFDYLSKL
jgi:replication factor A1